MHIFLSPALAQEELNKKIFNFQDLKCLPDEVREYSVSLQSERTPILIDNGEWRTCLRVLEFSPKKHDG